jgi:hypothetical protein
MVKRLALFSFLLTASMVAGAWCNVNGVMYPNRSPLCRHSQQASDDNEPSVERQAEASSGSWASVRQQAIEFCAKHFPSYALQEICVSNEKEGFEDMLGNFDMPASEAARAKGFCRKHFESFALQAVCMGNERDGYQKVYGRGVRNC